VQGKPHGADETLHEQDDRAQPQKRCINPRLQHDEQESAAARDVLPGYGFLPGGKEILLSYGGKIHRLNIETGQDKVIPFTAKIVRELGPVTPQGHEVQCDTRITVKWTLKERNGVME